jgi:hypothetical protein
MWCTSASAARCSSATSTKARSGGAACASCTPDARLPKSASSSPVSAKTDRQSSSTPGSPATTSTRSRPAFGPFIARSPPELGPFIPPPLR